MAIPPRTALGPVPARDGELRSYRRGSDYVLVARVGGKLKALDDVCNHAGCLLSGGHVAGNTVVCPCHEIAFDLDTGKNVTSPSLCGDQPAFEVTDEAGVAVLGEKKARR